MCNLHSAFRHTKFYVVCSEKNCSFSYVTVTEFNQFAQKFQYL